VNYLNAGIVSVSYSELLRSFCFPAPYCCIGCCVSENMKANTLRYFMHWCNDGPKS